MKNKRPLLTIVRTEGDAPYQAPKDQALKFDAKKMIFVLLVVGLLATALFVRNAKAAIARPGAESAVWKQGLAPGGLTCEDRLSSLFLAGTFLMPSSGEVMNLWVGKPRGAVSTDSAASEVWGLVGKVNEAQCEAQCKVTRFERFKKDMRPALMEMNCEGASLRLRLQSMSVPLRVQWRREEHGFETVVRMGSGVYGVAEAPLSLQLNRYAVAKK